MFSAQAQELLPMPERQPQKATAVYAPAAKPTAAMPAPRGAAPASIVGKKYVTFYQGFTNYGSAAAWIVVEQADNDSVLLKGVADGYDMKAKYDATTGQLTIPTGKVVGTNNTGLDIVVYNLLSSSNYGSYNSSPVVATVTDDKIVFADGFYGKTSTNLNYVRMCGITAKPANGTCKTAQLVFATLQPSTTYEYPVIVTKSAADKFTVQGMANWLYGHNFKVPFTVTQSSNTAKLLTTDSVDYYRDPSTGEVTGYFMLYRAKDSVNSVSTNPTFNIVNGATTTVSSPNILMECKKTATGWSGWLLRPFEITMNFDLYNAPIANMDSTTDIYYQVDPDMMTAEVKGCSPTLENVVIPSTMTYNGATYAVTSIGEKAFYSNKVITNLTIPSSIKTIGSMAFSGMTLLNEVHLPDVATWCNIYRVSSTSGPFYNSKMFQSTTEANQGKVYFEGIAEPNPSEITIPAGVKDLRYAFYYAGFLKKLTFGPDVKSAYYACYYSRALEEVTLNEGIENIEYAFYYNIALKSMDIPRSLTTLSQRALYNCTALTNLTMHTGMKMIGAYALYGNKGLTEIVLPSTLDTIATGAFNTCANITSITCRATTPPAVATDAIFSAFASKATLHVPSESIEAYKTANGWKNFIGFDNNVGVNAVNDEDPNAPAEFFTIQGIKVNNDNLAPGVYIRKQGNKTVKVMIK